MSNLIASFERIDVRREWDDGEWFYSVIDIVMLLIEGDKKTAQNYYHVLKGRLKSEGNQSLTGLGRKAHPL